MKYHCTLSLLMLAFVISCDEGGLIFIADSNEADVLTVDTSQVPDVSEEQALDSEDAVETDVFSGNVQPLFDIPQKSFRFETGGHADEAILVDVIAKDLPAIFGIALRIEWDSSVAELIDTEIEPLFGENAVYKAGVVRKGSLAIGMAYLGRKKGNERVLEGDVKVATLKFRPTSLSPFRISFFTPRCLIIDRSLSRVEVTYLSAIVNP